MFLTSVIKENHTTINETENKYSVAILHIYLFIYLPPECDFTLIQVLLRQILVTQNIAITRNHVIPYSPGNLRASLNSHSLSKQVLL